MKFIETAESFNRKILLPCAENSFNLKKAERNNENRVMINSVNCQILISMFGFDYQVSWEIFNVETFLREFSSLPIDKDINFEFRVWQKLEIED